ncbi:MAG: SURF1 family protein [Nitriliruptoraceae bacterium]
MHDLLRPRALLRHGLVLTVVVTCVALGQWQLSRLAEIREVNARLEERLAEPSVDLVALDPLPSAGAPPDDDRVAALEFRAVVARGTWRTDLEVLQRNREHLGESGFHVLTPLELDDGRLVLVRRGWVPSHLDEPPVSEAAPADGPVTVHGVLERPVSPPSFGPRDLDQGHLDRVFYPDTARLAGQMDGALIAPVLRMSAVDPAGAGDLPLALDGPRLDERNHQSYAVQWFTFALLAAVTYVVWLRRSDRTNR